jgi:hypothetical protein
MFGVSFKSRASLPGRIKGTTSGTRKQSLQQHVARSGSSWEMDNAVLQLRQLEVNRYAEGYLVGWAHEVHAKVQAAQQQERQLPAAGNPKKLSAADMWVASRLPDRLITCWLANHRGAYALH